MPSAVLPKLPVGLVLMGLCATAATLAPLLTYTLTLAVFGGAHVLSELRFVEARFAARFDKRLLAGMGVFLAGIVGIRLVKGLDLWGGPESIQAELAIVTGLGALVLPSLAAAGLGPLLVGLGVVGGVGIGLVTHPIWTILLLACLHNWTPVGFLAEGLPSTERRRGLSLGALAFGLGPLVVFAASLLLPGWPDLSVLPAGDLAANLGAYLPHSLHVVPWAVAAFSALVFTQCMHYAAVIGVLPRIAPGGPAAPTALGLSRIPAKTWLVALVGLSAVGFLGYTVDFKEARTWYGLIAAVHAWVEVPVLLMALLPLGNPSGAK